MSSNKVAGNIYQVSSDISEYIHLKEDNELLALENAKLRAKLLNSLHIKDTSLINIKDTAYLQQYSYTPAKIINNTTNRQKNYITINKGRLDGIRPEMAVISAKGVVGVVKNVSNHFATIVSFLNVDFEVSARIRNNKYAGTLQWDGKRSHKAILKDISTYAKVKVGDTIETTNYSALFPEGLYLGRIKKIKKVTGENFYAIDVLLANDFSSLTHVYVIKNFLKEEQKQLEALNEDEEQ